MARKHDVDLARVITRASLIKTTVICTTIILGLAIVCYTAYKMTEKPHWLTVALAVIAAASGPSTGIGIVIWLRRRYISKHHASNVELERMVDPKRRSSG